ncbi:MAG: FadR/GntR family transcriptional regulator [Alphaproteobacteria bacterium]
MNRSVWSFYPISGPRAFEEVVDQITFAIRTGAFKPGDRLPLVEELALAMKVSKPTIGEAIKVLSRAGVLVAQRGASGGLTVVSDTIPETLTMRRPSGWREATLKELVEARRPIEMQIVMLAAERATPEDFEALRYAVNQLKAQSNLHTMQRLHFENLFHYNLGRAARSELLSFYQHQILEQITLLLRDHFPQAVEVSTSAGHHERMLNAMERGDKKALMAIADEHLGLVESIAAKQAHAPARLGRRALA